MPTDMRRDASIHLSGYQVRDYDIVDYEMYALGDTGLQFRGPPPPSLERGAYFACLGAAQTFGCFCEQSFPDLLARDLDLPALNLGYGGAGPEFFLGQDSLLPYLNNARFVILQVMSGRSQSNSYYSCNGLEYVTLRDGGQKMGAMAAFRQLLHDPHPRTPLSCLPQRVRARLANLRARPRARALVAEIRAAWIASSLALLDRIEVPVVLLWYSKRPPERADDFSKARRLLGEYPHLITPEILAPLQARTAAYVECVTSRGSPQPLISRFTGQPTTVQTSSDRDDLGGTPWEANKYYPSPEMNEDAAAALAAPCRSLVA